MPLEAMVRMLARPSSAERTRRRERTRVALVSTVAGLVIFDVARARIVDTAAGIATNLLMAAVLVAVAGWAGVSAGELGTERSRVGSGLRLGAMASAVVIAVLIVAALVPALSGLLADERVDVGLGAMLVEVLITIPIGTVVLEELAFRGVLLALLRRRFTTARAVLVDAWLFGLWHVAPAVASGHSSAVAELSGSAGSTATVGATVLTTTIAGVVFCWLRLRSRSLLAPVMAHVATNSAAFAVAWAVAT